MTLNNFRTQLAADIELSCLLEATARKPGNVHPLASFADLDYSDFVASARAVSPVLAQVSHATVGESILEAALATRTAVSANTNLGIILLLAPLCAVESKLSVESVGDVLDQLTVDDSQYVYKAIDIASAGGMGEVSEQDLSDAPTASLVECMRLAQDRDLIARQYTNQFADVFALADELSRGKFRADWEQAVILLHLQIMQRFPDTLIARKLGADVAKQCSQRAEKILKADWPQTQRSQALFQEFDTWLRADGHKRNPGTSADMVAAVLFVGLRNGLIDALSTQTLLDSVANLRQRPASDSIPQA